MMEKDKKHIPLSVKVGADKTVIPAGKPGERLLEISLTAPPAPEDQRHVPLNLGLVLDRSGSMQGEKLRFVKQAAVHVIDLMGEEDRASVVIYDDKVKTLMPSQFLTKAVKSELKRKISGVETGGSTYLYGGWVTGCRQVAEVVTEKTFNRTLLLTDGLANVGERDIGVLSMHAQELFTRGISTSCFGVGNNYDEHLLEAMSNLGGGNFHFLETVNAIPLVFEREFEEIISVMVKDIQISLTLPASVVASVSAGWHTEREGERLKIFLGSLTAEQEKAVYVRLTNLDGASAGSLIVPVMVQGKDINQVAHAVESAVTFNLVPAGEEAAVEQDPSLMKRFAVVDLADKANEALKLERAGDRQGSSRVMQQSLKLHSSNISESTYDKYEHISKKMMMGMDEQERKRHHYQEYESRRFQQSIRHYPMHPHAGGLLVRIEGQSVLIRTGAAKSISKEPEWFFLDELYKLPQAQDGLNCDQLSAQLGKRVDVMLGMDVLKDLYLQVSPNRRVVELSRQPLRWQGQELTLQIKDGLPSIEVTVAGEAVPMRLTTGLKLSYVPAGIPAAAAPFARDGETLPHGQAVETPLYKLLMTFGGKVMPIVCGVMPEAERQALALSEGEGLLGGTLFEKVPATLAFPEGKMILLI